jgi:branched-chain amino acid transport system substrate-binding protein
MLENERKGGEEMKSMNDFKKTFFLLFLCGLLAILVLVQPAFAQQPLKTPSEYKIGALLPLTGPAAHSGEISVHMIKIACDEINNKGGIDGVKITPIFEDHEIRPGTAVAALRKLIDVDKIPISMIGYTTITLACSPIAEKREVLLINHGATAPVLVGAGKYTFHTVINAVQEITLPLVYLVETKGIKRIGSIYVNDDMGSSQNKFLKNTLVPKLGLQFVGEEAYSPGDKDFRTQIIKAKRWKVDAIFLGQHAQVWQFLKQAGELGLKSQWFSISAFSTTPQVLSVSGEMSVGTIYASQDWYAARYPVVKQVAANLRKAYGEEEAHALNAGKLNSYEFPYIVKELIERAKKKGGDFYTGARLREVLVADPTMRNPNIISSLDFDVKTGICMRPMVINTVAKVGDKYSFTEVKPYSWNEVGQLMKKYNIKMEMEKH